MENQFIMNEDVLWDYADELLDKADRDRVDIYLRQHPEWQTRLSEVREMRAMLGNLPLESPDSGFSAQVMQAWNTLQTEAAPTQRNNRVKWVFLGVAGVLLVLVLIPIVALFRMAGSIETPNLKLPEIQPERFIPDAAPLISNMAAFQVGFYLVLALATLRLLETYLTRNKRLRTLA